MKTCPHCGKKIQDKATVCPYCEQSLSSPWITNLISHIKNRIGLIIAIVFVGLAIVGGVFTANRMGLFAQKPTCYEQSQAYLNQFAPLFSQWNETSQKTSNLNKDQLELSVIALESVRQQIIELSPPQCAQEVHALFATYMDETLNGYNAFISGEPGDKVKSYIESASQAYTQYRALVLKLYPELSASPTP